MSRPVDAAVLAAGIVVAAFAAVLAAGIVVAALAAVWLISGVPAGAAALYVAYEALYVLLPGCLLYVLLSPSAGGWLRILAVGWPCGYAVEIGAFALTAALHARGAFALLPVAAIAMAATALLAGRDRARLDALRRLLGGSGGSAGAAWEDPGHVEGDAAWGDPSHVEGDAAAGARERARELLAVAVLLGVALIALALVFFTATPLPGSAHSVAYYPDNVHDISWAAEARHHWPITSPWVAGQPALYYVGIFIHIAAVNQVSGVPIATVVLRLLPAALILVIALQLWSIGRTLERTRWIGPLAIALFFIVEDLNLDPTRPWAFGIDLFKVLPTSPTYALGAVFFLGLLAIVQSWLSGAGGEPTRARSRLRVLVLLSLLAIAGCVTKTSAIAVFCGGLGLFWLWRLLCGRASRLLSYALAVTAGWLIAVYLLTLDGGTAGNLGLHPFDFLRTTIVAPVIFVHPSGWLALGGHSPLWYALLAIAFIGVSLCAYAPLLTAAWLLVDAHASTWRAADSDLASVCDGNRGGPQPATARPGAQPELASFCVAVAIVAVAAYSLLGAPGTSEGYFLVYGYIAMVPLAAQGLLRLWRSCSARVRRALVRSCGALLALGLAGAASSLAMAGAAKASWYIWYGAVYATVGGAALLAVVWLWPHLASLTPSPTGRALACCLPLICALGLVKPLAKDAPLALKTILHQRIAAIDSSSERGMTTPLYRGLEWVRDHTSSCAVIAVSNQISNLPLGSPPGPNHYDYNYYSAFAERRVFLEGWSVTPGGELGRQPYPGRLALNEAAVRGSATALRTLADDGVGYMLIDRTHGGGASEPASVSQLVFDNSALAVYRLRASADAPRHACGEVST